MSNSEESPTLSPNNVDESKSSLPSHEALTQPNPTLLLSILRVQEGRKGKPWRQG